MKIREISDFGKYREFNPILSKVTAFSRGETEEVLKGIRFDYAIIYYTDRVEIEDLVSDANAARVSEILTDKCLLEIRAFNENCEFHCMDVMGEKRGRLITDMEPESKIGEISVSEKEDREAGLQESDVFKEYEEYEAFDEWHKLWGSSSSDQKNLLREDRGVEVRLPFDVDENRYVFVKIRNYFNNCGELKVLDWRFVGFKTELKEKFS